MSIMKETKLHDEPSLLPTMFAFGSEKNSPYNFAGELVEGLLIAKNGLSKKNFLKQYCQGTLGASLDEPCIISVLVGSKDAIHKWLRMSGYARCVLWIEHVISESCNVKVDSCPKLELVYRKRDYEVSHVQILQGCKLFLSFPGLLNNKKNKTKEISENVNKFDSIALQQCDLKQVDYKNESNSIKLWKKTRRMQCYILMKVPSFKKLKNMLSLGGALWEFRRLLLQVSDLPEFLDIDFQSINLQERLTHHPYAVFLSGHDAIMTRKTSSGNFIWKVVRFNFEEGTVTLAGGETLKELLSCITNYIHPRLLDQDHLETTDQKGIHQDSVAYENTTCSLDWAVWRGVYQAGPLETILTSAFANEDDCMVLSSLTSFFSRWKDKDPCRCCVECDLGTTFRECRSNIVRNYTSKLSAKEQKAISELRSIKQETRWKGLRFLLNMLLNEVKDLNICGLQKSTLNTPIKSKRSTSISSKSSIDLENNPYFQQIIDSNRRHHVEEMENASLLPGLMGVMDRPFNRNDLRKKSKIIGSETQRALEVAEMNWRCFEETKSERSSSLVERAYIMNQPVLGWEQVLEWIDNGFLEVLLREGVDSIGEGGKVEFTNIEDLANACLQVIRILPREGSNRIVSYLILRLKTFFEYFTTQITGIPKDIIFGQELPFQHNLDKLKNTLEEIIHFCKLLATLVAYSVSIASGLAMLDGIFLVLNLYSTIVKYFPSDFNTIKILEKNNIIEIIPGRVFEVEKDCSKLSKSCTYSNKRVTWIQSPKANKIEEQLPLQEVYVSSWKSKNSPINAKVLDTNLDNRVQPNIPKINLVGISKGGTIASDRKNGARAHMYLQRTSRTILDIVWETKHYLLQTFITMFESQSINLNNCKTTMKAKIHEESTGLELLALLLSDLIGGYLNTFPSQITYKLNKAIFKLIYLLDKDFVNKFLPIQCHKEDQLNSQYKEEGPLWSGPGPPPRSKSPQIKLLGLLLVELKERMDHILATLIVTLPGHVLQGGKKHVNYKKMIKDNANLDYDILWINLAQLFTVLSSYISYWPTKEFKFEHVLRCCGGHFHQTLSLFASLGPIASWTPAHILAFQSLLKLLSLCIEESLGIDAKENWSEYEKFLWEMLVETWAHWNCIQSYISWMAFEVCPGCLIRNINDFKRKLLKPVYSYYLAIEKHIGMKGSSECLLEEFEEPDILPLKAMMFLHLVIILAQRRLYNHDKRLQDGNTYLCFRDNVLWFLHEIMNPTHGVLIMTIKSRPFQTCMDCKLQTSNCCILLEISSGVEKCSLILLAQIFNFNLSTTASCEQENYRNQYTNIYLSKNYLTPFLHILYSRFKMLYIKVTEQGRLESSCSFQENNACVDENVGSSTNHSSVESMAYNVKSEHLAIDEIILLCILHAQVLHAVARNLSIDGNQIFKDLCTMEFLIQEISLEYEFSQILDTKCDSNDEKVTNSTCSNIEGNILQKDSKVIKDLEGSNSSSNSTRACCMIPKLTQEYHLRNRTLFSEESMPQTSFSKNGINNENQHASLEHCFMKSHMNTRSASYSKILKKDANDTQKNVHINENDAIGENIPIRLSCNPIYGAVNFGSKFERKDSDSLWGIEYTKKIVYSGRFFDLNEEVERELAEEDDILGDENKHLPLEEVEPLSINRQLQLKNNKDTSVSPLSTQSTSSRSTKKVIQSITNNRPWVPKLNFSSGLQNAQCTVASKSPEEKLQNLYEGEFCSNKDNNTINEYKSPNLCSSYENEKLKRTIYYNSSLHILLLELIIALMINPQGSLEVHYSDRFPMEHKKINAPFYLFYHINHPHNEYVMPILAKNLDAFHPSACRILKLTWQALFDPSLYTNRIKIAQGALSQVYTANREIIKDGVSNNELVVLKVVALPKGPHEPCSFFDVYSEVEILETFQGDARVCQILDYGVEHDAFILVLKHYKCSLRAWRQCHTKHKSFENTPLYKRLPLYLQVYAAVLQAVKALEVHNVVHYDLKCDNILLEPLTSMVSEEEFWHPQWPPSDWTCAIPFCVSITDFGQSKVSYVEGGECTTRNRGTECVKSPEMLKLLSNNSRMDAQQANTPRIEDETSLGKAVDIWGLGCLLYELVTGEYLLYDDDWVRFFMRVTLATEELIPDEKAAKLDNYVPIIDFLRFILVRDPNSRPSLDDLIKNLKKLQAQFNVSNSKQQQQETQPHESLSLETFNKLASNVEDIESQIFEPFKDTYSSIMKHHATYKRCQTPYIIEPHCDNGCSNIVQKTKRKQRLLGRCCAWCCRD